MLKTDLHMHINTDPEDTFITHTAQELVDHAAAQNFDVLAITPHKQVFWDQEVMEYAQEKEILLIPGSELHIEGVDVLVYNVAPEEVENIHTLHELQEIKRNDTLIVAPHPFFIHNSIGNKIKQYVDLFDAVEYSHMYLRGINLNKRAVRFAKRHNLAVVANSDAHALWMMGDHFSFVDAEKTLNGVIQAIKQQQVTIKTRPRSLSETWEILKLLH